MYIQQLHAVRAWTAACQLEIRKSERHGLQWSSWCKKKTVDSTLPIQQMKRIHF